MERAVRYLWIASIVSAPFLAVVVYVPTHLENWGCDHPFGWPGGEPRDMFTAILYSRYNGKLAGALICLSVIFAALAIVRWNRRAGYAQVALGTSCLSAAVCHRLLDGPTFPAPYHAIFTVLAIQVFSGWTKTVGWSEREATSQRQA